jgi:hypothetical protein
MLEAERGMDRDSESQAVLRIELTRQESTLPL